MESEISSSPRVWVSAGLRSATWQQHLSSTHTQRSSQSPAEELQDNFTNAGFRAGTRTSADPQLLSRLQRQAFVDLVDRRGLGKCVSVVFSTSWQSQCRIKSYIRIKKHVYKHTQIANVLIWGVLRACVVMFICGELLTHLSVLFRLLIWHSLHLCFISTFYIYK